MDPKGEDARVPVLVEWAFLDSFSGRSAGRPDITSVAGGDGCGGCCAGFKFVMKDVVLRGYFWAVDDRVQEDEGGEESRV